MSDVLTPRRTKRYGWLTLLAVAVLGSVGLAAEHTRDTTSNRFHASCGDTYSLPSSDARVCNASVETRIGRYRQVPDASCSQRELRVRDVADSYTRGFYTGDRVLALRAPAQPATDRRARGIRSDASRHRRRLTSGRSHFSCAHPATPNTHLGGPRKTVTARGNSSSES